MENFSDKLLYLVGQCALQQGAKPPPSLNYG